MGCRLWSAAFVPALALASVSASAADQATSASAGVVDPFETRSVLTRPGTLVFEPSITFSHSSSLDVAIQGLTTVGLLVGLVHLSQVQRDTLTTGLGFKYGVTPRFEAELSLPYVYAEEQASSREAFETTELEVMRKTRGGGLGDIDLTLRYQLSAGLDGWPYVVGNLRVKSRTGESPFEVARRTITEDGEVIGEVLAGQPTGSGFWAVQPSVTFIYPADPAVLYGNVGYLVNIERDVGGEFGRIDPGDAFGFSFGMGLALNERTSFSLGYDHDVVFETKREGDAGVESAFDRYHVGNLLLGLTHRLGGSSLNLSLGIGVTENAPDVQLGVRVPLTVLQ